MKANKYFCTGTLALFLILLVAGCSENGSPNSYGENFPDFKKDRIEFTSEGLSEPLSSPFGEGKVYPLGKIRLDDGDLVALIVLKDEAEPIGEVKAELIRQGKRLDVITVAEADLGFYTYAEIELPSIRVFSESGGDEYGSTESVEEYQIGESTFERVKGK